MKLLSTETLSLRLVGYLHHSHNQQPVRCCMWRWRSRSIRQNSDRSFYDNDNIMKNSPTVRVNVGELKLLFFLFRCPSAFLFVYLLSGKTRFCHNVLVLRETVIKLTSVSDPDNVAELIPKEIGVEAMRSH